MRIGVWCHVEFVLMKLMMRREVQRRIPPPYARSPSALICATLASSSTRSNHSLCRSQAIFMEIQILINSGIFVVIMVRFASQMVCRDGLWKLILFLATVLSINAVLMVEKFGLAMAIYKAAMIAVGFLAGVVFIAYANRNDK